MTSPADRMSTASPTAGSAAVSRPRRPRGTGSLTQAEAPTIEVALVEDHPLYRFALEQAVASCPRLALAGSFGEGEPARAALTASPPDVAVIDIALPDISGVDLVARLAEAGVRTRLVLLSGHVSGPIAREALAAGAHGYLSKDLDAAAICEAIISAGSGQTVLSASVSAQVGWSLSDRARISDDLTERERAVLRLAATGKSAGQIGAALHISRSTVKVHLAHTYQKLGVSDRAAAVAIAVRRGLVT